MERANVLEGEVDERRNDTCGEYPFGDAEGDDRLDLSGPAIEGEKIDGSEDIDSIDSGRYDERDQEIAVCQGSDPRSGLEVVETLRGMLA
jgi:hypothetical protein